MDDDGSCEAGLKIGGDRHPRPLNETAAARWRDELAALAAERELNGLAGLLRSDHPDAARLAAVLDLSSYLNGIAFKNPEWVEALIGSSAADLIAATITELNRMPAPGTSDAALMAALRQAKRKVALLVALSDVFGAIRPVETTRILSDFAEAAVSAALRFCLLDLNASGKIALPDPDNPETGSGLFVLGMGKLGARELNYSSDIDLIVLFDETRPLTPDPMDAPEILSRLVRRLTRILAERTGDGYVARTDLRLRPDPGAMPLAISVAMALTYYEGSGRDWERAAMIKARPVAGDKAAAERFLEEISPFVWRRYLDFSAVAAIQDMKQRIDHHRGFDRVGLEGHNVKLGRGGIREIEFFAQAQQLIAGGRAPQLRQRRTDDALQALADGGWIDPATGAELTEDYWLLRQVEHAIQMIADEQSHTLPEEVEKLGAVARLAGFADEAALGAALLPCLKRVDGRYGRLFSEGRGERREAADTERLKRLSQSPDDAEAIAAIEDLGYQRGADIARVVHGWTLGRYRATRTATARARLAQIMPMLLAAFGKAHDPDAALTAFDRFLAGLPSGIQFFSLIASNPKMLELLADIITAAPALRETIAARPHVFDALLDPAFLDEVPDRDLLAERLSLSMGQARDYEDALSRLRIFASEQRFLVGARMLSGVIEADEAGAAFSNIADVVLEATLAAVAAEFQRIHGQVPGARIALLGMGRLGSRELTAGSDIDLILFYDHDEGVEASDGDRPLAPSTYFARLTQRLIAAMTAPMREGILYDVDFRLRPSGNKGPLATHIEAFRRYQERDAWTWERMALTRSRPVAGAPEFVALVTRTVGSILAARHVESAITKDVASMRQRISASKPPRGALDLKLRPGGLIDLEFLAQWALLTGRASPDLYGVATETVLAAGDWPCGVDGAALARAVNAFTRVIQLVRLGPEDVREVAALPAGLERAIRRSLRLAAEADLEVWLAAETATVRAAFVAVLGEAPEVGPRPATP
ncbi:bifunctional [glutamine synthetase] adenylyltransferase/[glutamine synthetase]-adenylyl-L-tyrosine phosphorylase [Jiella sp. MQZ9-1]|uniref:Bifunctional glutamine synthetase adenylyltransferase/adenylyl-removing enzyme n=1 Tax=Jiella flava TaxID=2816857 RepID=A0A939FVY2_9HYPH|nr:bifunctional [glutamine synthetase] adenylyltransferase/[glutamine synthetase]-adenylyl-L-tyrosine phosphorylase [Jiella flava]MBO0661854.1 bifunctional [glutamine synthetase] adenylyltransferase/[glutamine synthetase]-adenylyl-L-tyrosine phosphorylase [Jiella flava]MCD2470494.1 bifunctional [glutamine synthetase] adenylyltransferase/[glutamine synthetase]-adenylyl-L-tyrosine phosphorylase [Jiella flava]